MSSCLATAGVQAADTAPSSARTHQIRARSASAATCALTAGSSAAACASQAVERSPSRYPRRSTVTGSACQGRAHLGGDDNHGCPGLQQADGAPQRDLPAADHDRAPPGHRQRHRIGGNGVRCPAAGPAQPRRAGSWSRRPPGDRLLRPRPDHRHEFQAERSCAGVALPLTGISPGRPQVLLAAVRAVERHLPFAAHVSSSASARRTQLANCSPEARSAW